jgi:hypothetical protein
VGLFHPKAVRFFERQWLVNLILWSNYARLRDAALMEIGEFLPGTTLQVACVYRDLTNCLSIRDNDRAYGHIFLARLRAMGIRDRPITPRSPWQNGLAERLIGTLRRECLDQIVVFGEAHLRKILSAYAAYYKQARTHLALQKNAPIKRRVQRFGRIIAIPGLSGLHHHTLGYDFRKGQDQPRLCSPYAPLV